VRINAVNNSFNIIDDFCCSAEHYSGIKKYRHKLLKTSEPHSDDSYMFKTMNKENQELLLTIDDQQTEIELLKLKNIELEKRNIDLIAQLDQMKQKLAKYEQ
jgi:hypothetical protein